jgi:hypothetical protein
VVASDVSLHGRLTDRTPGIKRTNCLLITPTPGDLGHTKTVCVGAASRYFHHLVSLVSLPSPCAGIHGFRNRPLFIPSLLCLFWKRQGCRSIVCSLTFALSVMSESRRTRVVSLTSFFPLFASALQCLARKGAPSLKYFLPLRDSSIHHRSLFWSSSRSLADLFTSAAGCIAHPVDGVNPQAPPNVDHHGPHCPRAGKHPIFKGKRFPTSPYISDPTQH